MALNLAKTVLGYLKDHPEQKFTARQIAEWIFITYPAECQKKKKNSQFLTTDTSLLQQLAAEISALRLEKRQAEIKTTEGRPRKYYHSDKSANDEVQAAESANLAPSPAKADNAANAETKLSEHAMYPLLAG